MPDLLILIIALVLLVILLSSEKQGRTPWGVYVKGSVSALFVLTALIQPHPNPAYYQAILLGLIFGLVGDVCLALPGNRAFRFGLFAFLAGHVFYVWAFVRLTQFGDWASSIQLVLLIISGGAFWWLRPHVGKMMVPVTVYLIVITLMLAGALAVVRNPDLNAAGRWVILAGALYFYVSDLFVARQRFVTEQYLNRLIGLPLYYVGQFLIAYSVGLVG